MQWAPTLGRSSKTKEVEAKNSIEILAYQQQLQAAQAAQQQAAAEHRKREEELAAIGLLAFMRSS